MGDGVSIAKAPSIMHVNIAYDIKVIINTWSMLHEWDTKNLLYKKVC